MQREKAATISTLSRTFCRGLLINLKW
jgi:hypothetical protein